MGFSIHQLQTSSFRIEPGSIDGALAAIQALKGREPIVDRTGAHFSFVSAADFDAAATLEEMLAAWRWVTGDAGPDGAIDGIEFTGESHGDEDLLFAAIAPFVAPGSHIDMIGEDGVPFRWAFEGGAVYKVRGTTTFEPASPASRLDLAGLPGHVRFRSSAAGPE